VHPKEVAVARLLLLSKLQKSSIPKKETIRDKYKLYPNHRVKEQIAYLRVQAEPVQDRERLLQKRPNQS